MSSPASRLAELGLAPRRALGQHFLHDRAIVERICDVAAIPPDALIVEVGPGLGILTEALAKRAAKVITIERDQELASALAATMPGNVEIRAIDALDFEPAALGGPDYHLVSNLPYNMAPAILRRFLDDRFAPATCTFMVQREVAERMVSRPPSMTILAVAMQFHGIPKIAFHVGRGAFTPPPRVNSSVVRLPVQRKLDLDHDQIRQFFALVRAGFSARRKMLRNSLQDGGFDRSLVEELLERASIDPAARPQELDVDDWLTIYQASKAIEADDQ